MSPLVAAFIALAACGEDFAVRTDSTAIPLTVKEIFPPERSTLCARHSYRIGLTTELAPSEHESTVITAILCVNGCEQYPITLFFSAGVGAKSTLAWNVPVYRHDLDVTLVLRGRVGVQDQVDLARFTRRYLVSCRGHVVRHTNAHRSIRSNASWRPHFHRRRTLMH